MVDLIESIKMAIDSIKSAKLRSSLTTLGVIIGVAAVIANVSIGAGFSAFFTDEILKLGLMQYIFLHRNLIYCNIMN
ncbi:MAG: ABC transporter permease [Methanosarcinales archaeon]